MTNHVRNNLLSVTTLTGSLGSLSTFFVPTTIKRKKNSVNGMRLVTLFVIPKPLQNFKKIENKVRFL